MSTAPLITFRKLFSQLTASTLLRFIAKNQPMLECALFCYLGREENKHNLLKTNVELANIIRNNSNNHVHTEVRLDSMAATLIGLTASFLDQKSYTCFARTNRTCYLACNSPNQLEELMIQEIQFERDLSHFIALKKFSFNPQQPSLLPHTKKSNSLSLAKLEHVQICFTSQDYNDNEVMLATFHASSKLRFHHLESLCFTSMWDVDRNFLRVISAVQQLKGLSLVDSWVRSNATELQQAAPELKYLYVFLDMDGTNEPIVGEMANNILQAFSRQLEVLIFGFNHPFKPLCELLDFHQLKQVELFVKHRSDYQLLNIIADTAKQLEVINLHCVEYGFNAMHGLRNVIHGCKKLQRIICNEISEIPEILTIAETLEKEYFSMNACCKNKVQIIFHCFIPETDEQDQQKLIQQLVRLYHVVQPVAKNGLIGIEGINFQRKQVEHMKDRLLFGKVESRSDRLVMYNLCLMKDIWMTSLQNKLFPIA